MESEPAVKPVAGDIVRPSAAPVWVLLIGVGGLFLAALFFMGIVCAGICGHSVPCDTRVYAHMVLALLVSVGSGFLGGWAKAEGKLPALRQLVGLPPSGAGAPAAVANDNEGSPIVFGVGGGIAVFVVVFLLATWVDRDQEGQIGYKLEVINLEVSRPPAPSDKDWLVTVDFRIDPIPPSNYSLNLEFSAKPDFKELLVPAMLIQSPATGQAVDQIQGPVGKQAWIRLRVRDTTDHDIAFSKVVQVKEPTQ